MSDVTVAALDLDPDPFEPECQACGASLPRHPGNHAKGCQVGDAHRAILALREQIAALQEERMRWCLHDPVAVTRGTCECGASWDPVTRQWTRERQP